MTGALGRLHSLGRYAAWADEWESLVVAQGLEATTTPHGVVFPPSRWPPATAANVVASALRHQTPPAYPLALRLWTSAFGPGRRAGRCLSLALDGVCLLGIWTLARRAFGGRAALAAASFFAVSPLAGDMALEMRAYALGGAVALASSACLWKALRTDRLGWWLALGCATAALGYVHYFALTIPAAQAVYVVCVARRRSMAWPLAAMALAGALYLPWALTGFRAQWRSVGWVYAELGGRGIAGYSDVATPMATTRAAAYAGSVLFGLDPALMGLRARLVAPATAALALCVLLPAFRRFGPNSFGCLAAITGLAPPVFLATYAIVGAGVLVPMNVRHAYFGLPLLAIAFGAATGEARRPSGAARAGRQGVRLGQLAGLVLLLGAAVGSWSQSTAHPIKARLSTVEWVARYGAARPAALVLSGQEELAMRVAALRGRGGNAQLIAPTGLPAAPACPRTAESFGEVIVLGTLIESIAARRCLGGYKVVASSDDGAVVGLLLERPPTRSALEGP